MFKSIPDDAKAAVQGAQRAGIAGSHAGIAEGAECPIEVRPLGIGWKASRARMGDIEQSRL
jgi:hypothetical protein